MLIKLLPNAWVRKRYVESGRIFGDAVSYIGLGECHGFEAMLARWEKWEAEYARRGYRTLPIDDFIEYGGYSKPLEGLNAKRDQGEEPVFHAKIYREVYLGKIEPVVHMIDLSGSEPKWQGGSYALPSTKPPE